MTYFNPLDKFYKSTIGAVCADEKVTFRVKGDFDSVVLLLKKDGCVDDEVYNMVKTVDFFEIRLTLKKGLYFYCFLIDDSKFLGIGKDFNAVITDRPERYQLTAYEKNYHVPEWLNGGIIYQIFPDRFCRAEINKEIRKDKILHRNWQEKPVFEPNQFGQVMNNDFFGGDIKGIISKLDYLCGLGVTALYLNPIFEAYSNHRYDTGNYMNIDPLLGNEYDFIQLIKQAADKGIKIILDGVFNHTGDDSLYFNRYGNYESLGAYQSKNSPYYNWYNFKDYPDDYDSWWGIKVLPAINESNEDFIEYITGVNGVIDKYTKLGVSGWRLDVVDELPTQFVQKIRTAVKRVDSNAIVIGEVWEDASNKISYGVRREYFQGRELDSVMNYPLKNAVINFVKNKDAETLVKVINEQIDHYPRAVLHSLMNILATHDTFRLLSAVSNVNVDGKSKSELANFNLSEQELIAAKLNLKVATLLQYTLYGVPSVYYGDEIGMQGYTDPLNRGTYPWGEEDKEIFSWYKLLGEIRRSYSVFKRGDFEILYSNRGAFCFKREDNECSVLIAINLNENELTLNFEGKLRNLLDGVEYDSEFVLSKNDLAVLINEL